MNIMRWKTDFFAALDDDAVADRIGAVIAEDFGLKRSPEHVDRWETSVGTFTNRGIARRVAGHIIQEFLNK
jgi:hypothetical protein